MGVSSPAAGATAEKSLVAQRYRVGEELGAGGMGSVYRAFDERLERAVALKRLQHHASKRRSIVMLFEREYHTLAQLKHPCIISVYDYGLDESGPYYTMELLEGSDLREVAPLGYKQANRYLRDVASALALLHSRRLVHRDVSPRNVRLTHEGRAKLIDFGALASFGVSGEVIGTPAFIPPEVLRGMALDQRSDLYSLGALLYWTLTGRNAYPARHVSDLAVAWRQPPRLPSALCPEIPPALDQLVMSMLNFDPMARPASAAEVIERLSVIADLPDEPELLVAESYLLSSVMVGRERQLDVLRRRLLHLEQGRGSSVLVSGDRGSGKTQLLSAFGLEAQVRGTSIVRAQAERHRGAYALARKLIDATLEAAPTEAAAAASAYLPILSHIMPDLADRLSASPIKPCDLDPANRRTQIQGALQDFIFDVCKARPLVIMIDDVQHADESTAALLATLGHAARKHGLLLVASLGPDDEASAMMAVTALRKVSRRIKLPLLSQSEIIELVDALFGHLPNSGRTGRWLHELSAGNPAQCMELVQHLVRHQIIGYAQGTWVLPAELPRAQLPTGYREALVARLSLLSEKAHRLASAVSICRGPIPLALCVALANYTTESEVFVAIDELVAEGILVGSSDAYRFGQDAYREALARDLDAAVRQTLHRCAGETLLATAGDDPTSLLEAGWHLVRGDDEQRGAQLLKRAGLQLARGGSALEQAVPALETALEVARKYKWSQAECLQLQIPLVSAGYYVDWRLAYRYGDDTLDQLLYFTGLTTAKRLERWLGKRLALPVSAIIGMLRLSLLARGKLGNLGKAYTRLFTVAVAFAGVVSVTQDVTVAWRIANAIDALANLPRTHAGALVYAYVLRLAKVASGREVSSCAEGHALLAQLDDPTSFRGVSKAARESWKAGILFSMGLHEAQLPGRLALDRADQLDALGQKLNAMIADQLRMIHHAYRGEMKLAQPYRDRVELHAVRGGTTWQAEIFFPANLLMPFHLSADFAGLKRVTAELSRLCQELPSLAPYRDFGRGMLQLERGKTKEAIAILEHLLAEMQPRMKAGWATIYGNLAAAFNQAGDHARAKELCLQGMRMIEPRERAFCIFYLRHEWELAMAEAGLGELAQAESRLDGLIAEQQQGRNPMILGLLHGYRAQVARLHADEGAVRHHLGQMAEWYRETDNPALVARYQRFAILRGRESMRPSAPPAAIANLETETVYTQLSCLSDVTTCAKHALDLLLKEAGAAQGYLYLLNGGALQLAATSGDAPEPNGLITRLRWIVGEATELETGSEAEITRMATSEHNESISQAVADDLVPWLLHTDDGDRRYLVGVAAIRLGDHSLRRGLSALLEGIARSLREIARRNGESAFGTSTVAPAEAQTAIARGLRRSLPTTAAEARTSRPSSARVRS